MYGRIVICTHCGNRQDEHWFGTNCLGCGNICTDDGLRHPYDVLNKRALDVVEVSCPDCRGTGQDNPPPGEYHGLCPCCKGKGKI
jgi:hypothetical protein